MSNTCETCNSKNQYTEKYDAYYCKSCNTWLESACDDPTCEYCVNRPQTPDLTFS